MGIIPAGKRRDQVAQGERKYGSIFDNNFLDKIAVTGIDEIQGKLPPPKQQSVPEDLQNVMNDSPSRLNQNDSIPGTNTGRQNNNQQKGDIPLFDQYTGEPLTGLSGMDAWERATKAFAEHQNIGIRIDGDPKSGDWKVIISPKGKISPGRR